MLESILSSSLIDRAAATYSTQTDVVRKAAPVVAGQGTDFGSVLSQVMTDAVATIRDGEATAISGITGKASVQEVVEAVMSAEQSLQTAIAMRDKIVSAYLEISRMSI